MLRVIVVVKGVYVCLLSISVMVAISLPRLCRIAMDTRGNVVLYLSRRHVGLKQANSSTADNPSESAHRLTHTHTHNLT